MIKPPGPLGHYASGHSREFSADPLSFLLEQQQQYGDFFRFRLGLKPVFVVSNPEQIGRILISDHFTDKPGSERMQAAYASSVARIEGEAHLARRRMLAPAFTWDAMARLGNGLAETTARHLARWQDGQLRPLASSMKAIVFDSLILALLGKDGMQRRNELARVVPLIEAWLGRQPMEEADFRNAEAELATILRQVADARGPTLGQTGDVLDCLLAGVGGVTDGAASDGPALAATASGTLLVDEIAMMLMTTIPTASALAWLWHYLASQPDTLARAVAEVQSVVGQAQPATHHFAALRYLDHIAAETLRLHPPVWTLARVALRDWQHDQYTIPAGAEVMMSPYLVHRLPQYWIEPERFAPERFDADSPLYQTRPRLALFPFGGGSRKCIGERLTRLLMVLSCATVLQQFRPVLPVDYPLDYPAPGAGVRPMHNSNGLIFVRV
jgi:cytochrome P450